MAGPPNPFAGLGQKDGSTGSAGRGRGGAFGRPTPFQSRKTNTDPTAPHDQRVRGRGRGRGISSATRARGGRGVGASAAANVMRNKPESQTNPTGLVASPFASLKQNPPSARQTAQPSPFSSFGSSSPQSSAPLPNSDGTMVDSSRDPRKRPSARSTNGATRSSVPVEDVSFMNGYNERYEQLKIDRAKQREQAIKAGQMADPNQPTSLKQAITPVGTCTSMCPDFERVERIVQKMVDKSEKFLHPATNTLQNMEQKMLKRFRRSAAGYDEQLPSDIRTPGTLLQTMNYLIRHVIGGPEPLGLIHKFVWDRTRSIRNDFSVQQLTQEEDVKIAVTCLERIARFHIVSLHLLSSPANEEPFDRHQEREQLNNTMLSLMYYYDDNRGRIWFPNEDEFRAYYIIFSIHDQRPDLEARVQRWPPELRNSSRVQVALELFAAAGNTWEYQGTLDAKRPNAVAQGFYARFFGLVGSPGISYLMACVAEIYFNHMRQTAIRSIWKGYCRYPSSQQHKNEEWTIDELTTVLFFDDEGQTIKFCEDQDLELGDNANGELYLNWGSRPVDSVAFQPSSDHSFSETYVESKRSGRNLVSIILGLDIKEAARLGMIENSLLSERAFDESETQLETAVNNDDSLFVSDDDGETRIPACQTKETVAQDTNMNGTPTSSFNLNTGSIGFSQTPGRGELDITPDFPLSQASKESQPPGSPNPFTSLFPASNPNNNFATPAAPLAPLLNPFAKPFSPFASKTPETDHNNPPSFAMRGEEKSSSIFSGTGAFAPQSNRDTTPVTSSTYLFSSQNAFKPPSTLPPSPFNIPQPPSDDTLSQAVSSSAGPSDFAKPFTKAPLVSEEPEPLFSMSSRSVTQKESDSQEPTTFTKPFESKTTSSGPPLFFEPLLSKKTNDAPSIFLTPPQPPVLVDSKYPMPEGPTTFEMDQESSPTGQTVTPTGTATTDAIAPFEPTALIPSHTSTEQQEPAQAQEFGIVEIETTTTPPNGSQLGDLEASGSTNVTNNEKEPSSDVVERRIAWIEALKEAADRRRETFTTPTTRKRVFDEQEPIQPENDVKAPKVSKAECASTSRKSMALSSIKPLPKLPILELVESMTSQKPLENKPRVPKSSQVDEDELLLSAARIAAESLRSGPRLLDGWSSSAPFELSQPSFSPGSSVASSVAYSRSESPQLYVNGYDVALAPDTDLGLGRTMSRTEQRIRLTGGKGLAYKPLDFTPGKIWNSPKK